MQKSRNKKKKQVFNSKTAETNESSFSASPKKLKMQEIFIPRDSSRDSIDSSYKRIKKPMEGWR